MTTRLPFTIIDETFVHADDPAQPVTVQIEARAAGPLDRQRVAHAVQAALRVHPLARARQLPWSDGAVEYEWLIDDEAQVDPLALVTTDEGDDLDVLRADFYSRPLSLFESPPLRVRHVEHPDGDLIMVSVHHSAADGMGAIRFLQSVCRAYTGADDTTPDFDPAQARQLAVPTEPPGWSDRLHSGRMELQRLTRLGSLPARLAEHHPDSRAGYGFRTLRLPLEPIVSAPLRRSTGATVNDVLIAAAARAAGRWNNEHGDTASRVAVQMPINARPVAWSREMMANLVTGDSVSVNAADRASAEDCLRVVAGWTEAVKKRGPGPALAAMNNMPKFAVSGRRAATQWAMRAGRALAETLVLSNLGRVPDEFTGSESFRLTDVVFSPPAAMPFGLGVGAVALDDHLTLTLRHRWTLWDTAGNDRFAEILVDEIDQLTT
ncbi:MAG: hypothetical protein ACR2QE_08375 [Acidimicrobiales bacterium]